MISIDAITILALHGGDAGVRNIFISIRQLNYTLLTIVSVVFLLTAVLPEGQQSVMAADEGTLKERVDDVASSFEDNPIVQEIVAYIRADRKKSLCTPRDVAEQ